MNRSVNQLTASSLLQRGLTLVELLVSLAIGLVIALAAASAYLGTRATATAVSNMSSMNETGKLALDMIGRELQMAGYYPAIAPNSLTTVQSMGSFRNTKNALAAFNQGLFGCDRGVFNPTTGACPSPTAGAADSVVTNYFAAAELDPDTFGSGFDCLRQKVAVDPQNATQLLNNRPLYVSNRFALTSTTYTVPGVAGGPGRTVTTNSLACNGNGKNPNDTVYQPIFDGIEDMSFTYGVHAGTGSLSPGTYYSAAEVTALPTAGGLTGWQRVTAVRACVLTRSLDNVRTQDKAGSLRTYANCRGSMITYAATDRTLHKKYERVFAIRNNLNGTY
jgi:type IV pilus assembly protein PilW